MTDLLAKTAAWAGFVAAGALAAGIPSDSDSWTMLIEKFGVLAFVIVCAVLGLAFLVPRGLDIFKDYLARQDARQDAMRQEFLTALERRDAIQEKYAQAAAELKAAVQDNTVATRELTRHTK